MAINKYGYIRVSTTEQNTERQVVAMAPFGIAKENMFVDFQSGKDFDRPAYKKLVSLLRPGDLLHIKSIDRLGRDYAEIIGQWKHIVHVLGADVKVLDMPLLDTTYCKDLLGTFISDLVLQVLSFSAQLERENILARQSEGIAAAKERGVAFGRRALPLPEGFDALVERWRRGEISGETVAALCGFSIRTLYERTRKLRKQKTK